MLRGSLNDPLTEVANTSYFKRKIKKIYFLFFNIYTNNFSIKLFVSLLLLRIFSSLKPISSPGLETDDEWLIMLREEKMISLFIFAIEGG